MQYLNSILLHHLFHMLLLQLILSLEVFVHSIVQLALLNFRKVFATEVEEQL